MSASKRKKVTQGSNRTPAPVFPEIAQKSCLCPFGHKLDTQPKPSFLSTKPPQISLAPHSLTIILGQSLKVPFSLPSWDGLKVAQGRQKCHPKPENLSFLRLGPPNSLVCPLFRREHRVYVQATPVPDSQYPVSICTFGLIIY